MTVRRTLLLLVATLIAIPLIVGAINISQAESPAAQQQQPTQETPQAFRPQATAEPTASTISALGSVEADTVVPLYFQTSGTVQNIYVQIGDFVKTGDVLADLDASDAWNSYNQAKLNLENAQISMNMLNEPPSADDLKVAQANLASAQAAYGNTANPMSADALQAAQLKYQQSQDQLAALQQARQFMNGSTDQIALQDAKIGAASFNAEIARLQLQQQTTPSSTSLWQASIRITQAQLNLDKLMAGPTQAQLDSAQLAIDRAQATVDDAQTALTRMQLIAPHNGYVTALNLTIGQGAGAQAEAIELSDLSQLRITVPVNELDIERIQEGANATIQLDALPGVDIPGKVENIGWLSTTSSDGIVTYGVRIALNTTDPRVRIGMTGEVAIDTGSTNT
ncbi:MAG: HlyD family efflux transporter periplasmic adaptor subunit [Chloroflexi bacterium]|nr:HlyD family efflux transporter periplasmic adaptor subunit [Chloroflexota bacterium]